MQKQQNVDVFSESWYGRFSFFFFKDKYHFSTSNSKLIQL